MQAIHPDAEAALIARAMVEQDDRAFGELVRQHQSRVRGFLQRLCGEPALADDLAQEVFLIAGRKLSAYGTRGSFNAWLCSIAYRCFLQQRRRHRRELEINESFSAGAQDRYHGITPEQMDLERAIARLGTKEAAAITLNCSYGFSHSEVSAILQLPLGTVKSLISRGLPKLRAMLGEETESDRRMSDE